MTTDSIINQIKLQSPKGLAKTYEGICEEYRKRLCDQWDLNVNESYWIPSDRPGTILALCDLEYSLRMEDVRLFVDLCTSYEDFCEYWDYLFKCVHAYPINAFSWFVNGLRPKDLKKCKRPN